MRRDAESKGADVDVRLSDFELKFTEFTGLKDDVER